MPRMLDSRARDPESSEVSTTKFSGSQRDFQWARCRFWCGAAWPRDAVSVVRRDDSAVAEIRRLNGEDSDHRDPSDAGW